MSFCFQLGFCVCCMQTYTNAKDHKRKKKLYCTKTRPTGIFFHKENNNPNSLRTESKARMWAAGWACSRPHGTSQLVEAQFVHTCSVCCIRLSLQTQFSTCFANCFFSCVNSIFYLVNAYIHNFKAKIAEKTS